MNVLVLGAAVSGVAAARLAKAQGHRVDIYDRSARAVGRLHGAGYTLHSGEWSNWFLRGIDLVVTSPGIPEHAAPIRSSVERAVPIVSEMEYAASYLGAPYVAVTGTNGKTTVAEAAAAMLVASGRRACAAGNIGTALSSVVGPEWDVVVVEASSFQLRFTDRFHPAAAAITNVAADHLDWHGTEEAYAAAKGRIYARMTAEDVVAYDADDPAGSALAARSRARTVAVSGTSLTADGYGVEDGALVLDGVTVAAPPVGAPFLADLQLAAVLARAGGAGPSGIMTAIERFRPGAHRRTVVSEHNGVRFVDDSKATNPHAAMASASSFPSVILIAGGRNKSLDLAPLARVPSVMRLVGLGEAADELAAAAVVPFHRASTMEEAVAIAVAHARPGDVVLLAPGCASFDMFDSYAARGDAFVAAVRAMEGAA